ncbi:MAG: hypothetical protein R3F11_28210 [Verrucomicrobiales bacterium]
MSPGSIFYHFSRRQPLSRFSPGDDIPGSSFNLDVDAGDVFAEDAEADELDAAEGEDGDGEGGESEDFEFRK